MRIPLPRSSSGRLILLLMLALVVAQGFSLFIFSYERERLIESSIREYMQDRTASVAALLERSPDTWHSRILRNSSRGRLRFQLSSDNPLAGQPQNELQHLRKEQLPEGFRRDIEHHRAHKKRKTLTENFNDRETDSVVALSQQLANGSWLVAVKVIPEPPRNWGKSSLLSLLMAVFLAGLVVWITRQWIARPLAKLGDAAERLGRGEQIESLAETGPEDIRKTTRAFNQMRERLERFVSDRTRMLAAISHDLRTPITALRLRAEFIEDRENRDKILTTLDEMQSMTEATLTFSKSDHSNEPTRAVDLSALLDALCEDYLALGKKIACISPDRIIYRCRPVAIKRALRNLIDNALAYGGEADINLQKNSRSIEIRITDRGPGIAQADLERVFNPFVRLEESRNHDTGGIGLGLSIARTVIHAHGGELVLSNLEKQGLLAKVTLPVERSD